MAVGPGTLKVSGLRETIRAFGVLEKTVRAELYAELRKAAEPVAADARERLAGYTGINLGTIGPRTSVRGAFVTQRARKVTGLRPDFGTLQMTHGLLPALEAHADSIEEAGAEALDKVTRAAGFI